MKIRTLLLATLLAPGLAFAGSAGKTMPAAHSHSPSLSGFYLTAESGFSMPGNVKAKADVAGTVTAKFKTKTSYVVGLGVGYTVNEYFRTDVKLGYRQWGFKQSVAATAVAAKGTYSNTSGMLNGYVEMPNSTMFTPYALLGVGVGKTSMHTKQTPKDGNTVITTNDLNFMWNAGVGARANIYNNFAVDLTYRYVSFGTTTLKNGGATVTKIKYKGLKANEFLVGLVYKI